MGRVGWLGRLGRLGRLGLLGLVGEVGEVVEVVEVGEAVGEAVGEVYLNGLAVWSRTVRRCVCSWRRNSNATCRIERCV